jgi:hypothetical protein
MAKKKSPKKSVKKASTKKLPAKKSLAKKSLAKKPPAKNPVAKKPPSKKTTKAKQATLRSRTSTQEAYTYRVVSVPNGCTEFSDGDLVTLYFTPPPPATHAWNAGPQCNPVNVVLDE